MFVEQSGKKKIPVQPRRPNGRASFWASQRNVLYLWAGLAAFIGACLAMPAFFFTGAILFSGFGKSDAKPREILTWTDPTTPVTLALSLRRGSFVHCYSMLHVRGKDTQQSCQLDDDMRFGTAAFLVYGDWVLVLNDDHAVGGYNRATGQLYGEYDWTDLPFTVREGQGVIAAEVHHGTQPAYPAQYPFFREGERPATQPDTPPTSKANQ